MIRLKFGYTDKTILNVDKMFFASLSSEWFKDPFVIDMVEQVDKVKSLGIGIFSSPVMPVVSSCNLSTGVKTLVLLYHMPQYEYIITNCGDNCAKWILEIGKRKDISVRLTRIMNFGEQFDIVLNDNIHVTSMPQLIRHFKEEYCDQFLHKKPKM